MNRLLAILLALGASVWASAGTYTIRDTKLLSSPAATYQFIGRVAIDGNSVITLADRAGGRAALLYQRGTDGRWTFQRTLFDVTEAPEFLRASLAMKNGIAVIQLTDTAVIFEHVGSAWVPAATSVPLRHPGGFAISGRRILIGGNQCDYDALIYEKATTGVWTETGRMNDGNGGCTAAGVDVELNYDTALLHDAGSLVTVYTANGTQWNQTASFLVPPEAGVPYGPMALQKNTAVAPGSAIFRNNGDPINGWAYSGQLQPVDYGNGPGHAFQVKYRDGVLLASEGWGEIHGNTKVYVYHENADHTFAHVGIIETLGWTQDFDVSGNSVVVGSEDYGGELVVSVFTLPSPIVPPAPVANDFDARNVSGFQTTAGSQFALAGDSSNYVYRQSSVAGESHAVLTNSDWANFQSIEADVTPTAFDGTDRWVGLGLRYVDANNQYYVTLRSSNVVQLKKKVNGVFTTLAQQALPITLSVKHNVSFSIAGSSLRVSVDHGSPLFANDTALTHGRVALMTNRARADFDNVYASATSPLTILTKDYTWYDWGRPFTFNGGHWEVTGTDNPEGLSQTTTDGSATAVIGTSVDEQEVRAHLRLDSYAASQQGAWFGLFARYVDARNHYYLSIRSSNQLQIRKQVNGVISVLKSVAYTAAPGAMHEYTFSALGNELHAFVDGKLVAKASDAELPRGVYGVGTYRTAATLQDMTVTQP
jgi:hypothetical protein